MSPSSDSGSIKALPSSAGKDSHYPVRRGFVGHFFFGLGVTASYLLLRFRSSGRKNIPKEIPYVIAANHQTFVDGMWIARFLPRRHFAKMCCLAGSDLETSYGLLGRLIMRVGRGIAVDRYGSPVRGLIKAKKEVENGNIMLVHPEGTRTHDGMVAEFKDGAAYMAVKAGVPLLPVYIEGGYEVLSRHMKRPQTWDRVNKRRKAVTVHYGEPLLPEQFGGNPKKMTAALQEWMTQMEKKANGNASGMTSKRT
ncbi:MAG: 1-acyl-sn-glycerol-3-phosphate acyltransferase [Clostridiaceae bacterium]|nr:1-acyl-sn-glycerol-3-phosphate acyltransferase [Clostridiaceae bacterium]